LDLGLGGSITPAERQAGFDRLLILSQAVSKRAQFSDANSLSVLKPSIQLVSLHLSDHLDELVDMFGSSPNLFISLT